MQTDDETRLAQPDPFGAPGHYLVTAISEELATLGLGGGADPCRLCRSGLSGLCFPGRVAPASWSLLLPGGRNCLRSFRNLPTTGHRAYFGNFYFDRVSHGHIGGW